MREPVGWLLAVLAATVSAGCAVRAGVEPPALPAGPQQGGTLIFAAGIPNQTVHPFKGGTADINRIVGTVYEPLLSFRVEQGRDYRIESEVVPALAERWEQPDATSYRFSIRKGVTWHDGRSLTPEDVVATYRWVQDAQNGASIRAALAPLATVEAPDDHTVRLTTKVPSPLFLEDLADRNLYIVPKHLLEGGDDLAKTAVGTGAFKLQSHEPTRENAYVRNDRYWRQGQPYLEGYRQVWGLDRSATIAAFIAGQNDLLQVTDRPQLDPVLKARPETQFSSTPSDSGTAVVLNLKRSGLDDVRIRRALHMGLDRRAMVKSITFGDGVINPPAVAGWKQGWAIPPEELLKMPGYREDRSQDVAEAKRLLAEAGYASGLSLRLLYQQDKTTPPPVAEAAAAQLKAIGVEVVLEPRDSATYTKLEREGSFEMEVGVAAKQFRDRVHSGGTLNVVGIKDAKMDQLLDDAASAMDVVARKRATLELQRYALEQAYILPSIEFPTYALWQPWVKDYYAQPYVIVTFDRLNAPQLWLDLALLPADRRGQE